MDKDENNYWHMRTPYDTTVVSKLHNSQEKISIRNLFQLYMNTFVGANIAETCIFSIDATKATTLHSGFTAMILKSFMFHSSRVMLYNVFRRRFINIDAENQEMISIPSALMCGGAAGCIAQALYHPFEMVTMHKPRASTFMSTLKSFHGKSGVARMLRELGPRCTHACLLTAGDVVTYDLCKRNLKKHLQLKDDLPVHFASSIIAGLVVSLLSHPVDVIRSCLLSQPTDENGKGLYYKGSLDCIVKLIKEEGAFRLYKGFLPCWLRLGSWSVIFWLSVEQLRSWEGQTGF